MNEIATKNENIKLIYLKSLAFIKNVSMGHNSHRNKKN